jgi:septum site-determining protein MinC
MSMEGTLGQEPSEAHSGLEREEKQSVQAYIAIKGTRNGLLLTLEPGTPFGVLLNALAERLAEAPGFFRGASLAVDTSRRKLHLSERTQLEALLAHYQMSVMPFEQVTSVHREPETSTLLSTSPKPPTSPLAPASAAASATQPAEKGQTGQNARESDDTLFLRRTVRSGQAIHHASNIVVLGDVNPGAEIIAGGDIIVWGVLRGMVHAGYPNNEQALVCALSLAPVQLRIAHLLSRPPEGFEPPPRPEVASIRQNQIIVEAWTNGRPPRKT